MQYLLVFGMDSWFGIFHWWCLLDRHETLKTTERIIRILLLPFHLLLDNLIIGHRRLAALILSQFRKYSTSYSSFEIIHEFWRKHLVILNKVSLIGILQSLQLPPWFTYKLLNCFFPLIQRSSIIVVQTWTIQGLAVDLAKELRLSLLASFVGMLGWMGLLLRRQLFIHSLKLWSGFVVYADPMVERTNIFVTFDCETITITWLSRDNILVILLLDSHKITAAVWSEDLASGVIFNFRPCGRCIKFDGIVLTDFLVELLLCSLVMGVDLIELAVGCRLWLLLIISKLIYDARHVWCILLLRLTWNYSVQKACFLCFTPIDWALGRIC